MYSQMHTIQSQEDRGLVHSKLKKWEKPRNQFFQSSITTLPGPSITIRDEQVPYTRQTADALDKARSVSSRSVVDLQDRSDTVSVATSDASFKNNIPRLYGGKFSPENIPSVDFKKRK